MKINVKNLPDVTVVELAGDIDASTAPAMQEKVLPLAQSKSKILLDMTQVPYTSSAGLRVLLSLFKEVKKNEGKLVLVGVSEEIQDTMSVTGFADYFVFCDRVDNGIKALA